MDLLLAGKTALVTGASRGIGRAAAHALAREGVDVVIAARGRDVLEETARQIAEDTGRKIVPITVDTGDDSSVRALVEQATNVLGGIDILVNSAASVTGANAPGVPVFPKLAETTDDAFWGDVNVKVVGYLRTARAVAPQMAERGWGRIINVSGLGAREARSIVRTVRNVSVAALTKNLADELGPKGINVTVVHPGATRTETNFSTSADAVRRRAEEEGRTVAEMEGIMANNAINRIVDASEVADIIAFLASPRSVAIAGDAIAAGGGVLGAVYY